MDRAIEDLGVVGEAVASWVRAFAPSLLSAAILIAVGWLVGLLLARVTSRVIDRVAPGLDERATRISANPLGIQRRLADIVGTFVFWAVFVIFVGAAAEAVGLPVLATWLNEAVSFLPRILLGGLIVLAGFVVGALARDATATAARAAGLTRGDLLGRVAQIAIVTAAGVAGVEQLGIDSQFLTATLSVTIGAALGGAALAFALGARTEVSNIVAMHYVGRTYRIGQRVTLGDVTGRIRELTTTAVVLETETERVHVPGKVFSESVSRLLTTDA